jgi:hypothetical protein
MGALIYLNTTSGLWLFLIFVVAGNRAKYEREKCSLLNSHGPFGELACLIPEMSFGPRFNVPDQAESLNLGKPHASVFFHIIVISRNCCNDGHLGFRRLVGPQPNMTGWV